MIPMAGANSSVPPAHDRSWHKTHEPFKDSGVIL